MPFICLNVASMTKQNSLVISDNLSDTICQKDIIMIVSNANLFECLGLEHYTLVHFRHAFFECTEDPIEKVK